MLRQIKMRHCFELALLDPHPIPPPFRGRGEV